MIQIIIRNVPLKTYNQLKMIAKKSRTSINKTIISLINKSLGIDDSSGKMRDLSDVAGTWSEQEFNAFLENVTIFDAIDEEVWR